MASFLLRPQDGGRDIEIPGGKTTIGRGPFLGVTDKRVSRCHAEIELSDGKLTVLPLHTNPTFCKFGANAKFFPLKKNEAQEIHDGDTISLLPDTLCFTIVFKGCVSKNSEEKEDIRKNAENKLASNGSLVVVDINKNCSEKSLVSKNLLSESFLDEFMDKRRLAETGTPTFTEAYPQGWKEARGNPVAEFPEIHFPAILSNKDIVSSTKAEVNPARLLQKTRKLPSWLIQPSNSATKSTKEKQGKAASGNSGIEGKTSTVSNKRGKSTSKPASKQYNRDLVEDFIGNESDDDEKESSRMTKAATKGTVGKKRTSADTGCDEGDIIPIKRNKRTKRISSENDYDDLPLQQTGVGLKQGSPIDEEAMTSAISKEREETGIDDDDDDDDDDERETTKLPLCPHGRNCYRRNPAHFKEYSHSVKHSKADNEGDSDSENRPECPYGTSCYRKNPQHKRDFKHTEAPERPKRKKTKHKSVLDNESDDDGPNTYDHDDSFLDDEKLSTSSFSAESADDSDWQPQGGDDKDHVENVTELLSEARGFLRSKNMAKPV
ncbi:aprataxin and PNK-like factor [Montipora foliosa]|uniref:aprataxin and PNK-like factor n=1 Tax=Montipora foliosa TaxID=591990 RepID=UPI0035F1C9A4